MNAAATPHKTRATVFRNDSVVKSAVFKGRTGGEADQKARTWGEIEARQITNGSYKTERLS